ncbi:MAG: hypothetical protein ACRCT1_19180 [Microcoleaceae cyanobacterium]|jgi:hypothetical protein
MGSLSKTKKINKMEPIPHSWADIEPDIIYQTLTGMLVSFSKKQIRLCQRYDPHHKHLKAIQNGRVATDGTIGLVPSQEEGYDLKSKVLGEGGDYRYHGKYIEGVLHFPGVKTSH